MNLKVFKYKNSTVEPFLEFDSDEEFTDFCLAPYTEFQQPKSEGDHATWQGVYSEEYLWCVKNGIKFVIKDKDSEVCKHQCVCKRLPLKYPDNLKDLNPREEMVGVRIPVENLEDIVSLPQHF